MSEKISDFLKIAYEKGKIQDVSEAFKNFLVEEEWHKGEIRNVLGEPILTTKREP